MRVPDAIRPYRHEERDALRREHMVSRGWDLDGTSERGCTCGEWSLWEDCPIVRLLTMLDGETAWETTPYDSEG